MIKELQLCLFQDFLTFNKIFISPQVKRGWLLVINWYIPVELRVAEGLKILKVHSKV